MLKQIPGDLKSVNIEESGDVGFVEIELFESGSSLHPLASNHLGDSGSRNHTIHARAIVAGTAAWNIFQSLSPIA